ncbi:IclR family transcriptional regulator [Microlunatus sp. GCM10028923]|uniref:IclR family transcriptional regulator n=1 Tax=Microlunatus sp. GCM10028923 TaxID=3273400 RepID=UPI00361FC596
MSVIERVDRMQSLGRGLAVLDQLVRASGPLTATEVGHRCGVHQTTASRILRDLVAAGYARKLGYREFAPDYGLLALGLRAGEHLPITLRPKLAMERAAAMCSGLSVSLCMLWRRQLLYFDQATHGQDTRLFSGRDFPLHLSSPGLLFLLELPQRSALELLAGSRAKFGWDQPTAAVPSTPSELLRVARRSLRQQTLVLPQWAAIGHVTAATRLRDHEGHPLALAISGPSDVLTSEGVRLKLHQARRLVEAAIS